MKNQESFNQQVTRVINEMVAAGELVTKVDQNGTILYGLPKTKKIMKKYKVSKEIKQKRTQAAKKAWATRRLNIVAKQVAAYELSKRFTARASKSTKKDKKSAPLINDCLLVTNKSVKLKVGSQAKWEARSKAAKKAWVTRRLTKILHDAGAKFKFKANSKWEARSSAAKKAWVTRRALGWTACKSDSKTQVLTDMNNVLSATKALNNTLLEAGII